MKISVQTDRRLVRGRGSRRHLLALVVAPAGEPRRRPPVNLGLVLDRSGSMGGDKIRLAREAVVAALRRLEPRDRFSVVAYDNEVDLVVPSTPATPAEIKRVVPRILGIQARGGTNLCGGWLRGCEQVGLGQEPGAVDRVLLLTDGLANDGITDRAEIARHASELRSRGIATTTIGVGEDFDESLLGSMADGGGGHFYYVRRDEEIPACIQSEVGEALEVTLRQARLRFTPASLGAVKPIGPFPTRHDDGGCVIELGDLVSNQELALPVVVSLSGRHALGVVLSMTVALEASDMPGAEAAVSWTVAAKADVDAQPRNVVVDRAVAEAYAARARRDALELNRRGDYDAARTCLRDVATHVGTYASGDAELQGLVLELGRAADEHALPLEGFKARFMATHVAMKGRSSSGRATRVPVFREAGTLGLIATTAAHLAAATHVLGNRNRAVLHPGVEAVLRDATHGIAVSLGGASVLAPPVEARLVARTGKVTDDRLSIAFVEQQLADGRLVHWHERQQVAVASTIGWEQSRTPLATWVGITLLAFGPRLLSSAWTPLADTHDGPCVLDLVRHPYEQRDAATTAALCPSCVVRLVAAGLTRTDLETFRSLIRGLAEGDGRPTHAS